MATHTPPAFRSVTFRSDERHASASWLVCNYAGDSFSKQERQRIGNKHIACSNVTNLSHEVIQFLLRVVVFFGHFLVLGLPLGVGLLKGLDFALVMASFDVSLAEPVKRLSALALK